MAKTILIVAQDEQILRGLKVLLESEGYQVRTSREGPEALTALAESPPDLILMEVVQPPEVAYEEARRLKETSPRTPVVLMTEAPLSQADKTLGLQAGVDGFIPKPQAFPELLAYIEERLQRAEVVQGGGGTALEASTGILLAACPECRAKFRVRGQTPSGGPQRLKCPNCQCIFLVGLAQLERVEPPSAAPSKRPLGEKILLVEDTELFRNYVSDILTSAGYRVIAVKSGTEALAVLEQERPDLVLTDLLLPGLHGFDLCKEVKVRFSLPVIMMTGVYKSLQYQLEGRWRYGADEFLVKPFKPEELLERIKAVLAKGKGEG